MKKNIEIDKKAGTVTVEVNVSERNYVREPILTFRTRDIVLLLEKDGIEVETCIQNDVVNNDGRKPKLTGTWVFKLKQANKPESRKPSIKESPSPQAKTSSLTKESESDKIEIKNRTSKRRK